MKDLNLRDEARFQQPPQPADMVSTQVRQVWAFVGQDVPMPDMLQSLAVSRSMVRWLCSSHAGGGWVGLTPQHNITLCASLCAGLVV